MSEGFAPPFDGELRLAQSLSLSTLLAREDCDRGALRVSHPSALNTRCPGRGAITSLRRSQDPRDRVPFARVRLVNSAMSISGGMGVMRLSVASGDVAVMDTRQPLRTRYPVVVHAGPLR